ncbi:major facilitator superfamily MFS_1 [Tsukamurella paurometabola DSM 20162]|uniref:Major facilitator superfamily MFS_1 n=1 Tax=Tsukamurella paurometabola (strain ATCC 8368 / DSM 20162 / CCUG 35730 / CIP 100753 / JCM 10117 / KCTC 9821 / NBRC 16120 / NCIMB 702349 / NCTC 13040) TaxID=521096 RepID=D5UQ94_TSUPD|nr:MFS transporter [Tsukamurella paurometabola]ADG78864.1 major facilitator superfamily MFS_1 [Tsukamurella paurometabola DSM 20162]
MSGDGTATYPRAAVAVLCAAGIVVALMQTIIVPLIPELPDMLHASPSNASWTLTITLLVGAVGTPIAGRLGDMFGKRRVLLGTMTAVAVGSTVCAMSPAFIPFLLGRGLQGLGIGAIAVGISILRDIVPAARLGSAVGTMSASLGVGGALGLPIAAVIARHVNWHALFWVCAIAAVACGVAIFRLVPTGPADPGGSFDAVGTAGLTVVLTLILLPLSKAAEWGWTSPVTLTLFAAFLLAGSLWWRYELRTPNALIDVRTLLRRPILLTNAASVATGFAFYAMQLMPIQILMAPDSAPTGLGLGMVNASLVLMPSGLVMFAFTRVSARITDRHGARLSLALGAVVIAGGYLILLLAIVGPWPVGWWWILASSATVGAGLGIAYSAMPALIMAVVPVEQTGEANGVNALMRSVGTATATAVVAMVLTGDAVSTMTLDGNVETPSSGAYTATTLLGLTICLLAAICALAIPRLRPGSAIASRC